MEIGALTLFKRMHSNGTPGIPVGLLIGTGRRILQTIGLQQDDVCRDLDDAELDDSGFEHFPEVESFVPKKARKTRVNAHSQRKR